MELGQLETFLAVARAGTVTGAANNRGLAPSSVSAQLRALERSLGIALFERTPRGMRLTEAGDRMRIWSVRLLQQADQARREVTRRSSSVRLGALETLAATHVPAILSRIADQWPDIAVDVAALHSREQLLTHVHAGNLDAGLLFDTGDTLGSLGFPAPAELDFLDLESVPLAVVAAADHPLAHRTNITVQEISAQHLLVSPPGCSFRMAAAQLFPDSGPRTELASITVIRAWASQGLGIALLPQFAIQTELATGALRSLHLTPATLIPHLTLRLVWRRDSDNDPDVRHLLYASSA